MAGIASNHGFEAIKVGGVEDHAHSLLLLAPTIPLAKAVQILKSMLFKMDKRYENRGQGLRAQEGYGAFSVSASQTEDVIKYIADQAAHHARRT